MKLFIKKTISFFVLCMLSFIILSTVLMKLFPQGSFYLFGSQEWMRIKQRIITSKGKIDNDTLYVGCSVSGQLLPFNWNNQLTTNGAINPIGNYFLIKNALANNKNIKCVIYMSIPDVIGHKLSSERTFQYVVKPFYTFENRKEIMGSQKVNEVLSRNNLLFLCLFDSYKIIALNDYNYSDGIEKPIDTLSPESIEWLIKIKNLCQKRDVQFYLASPPVPISKREMTSDWIKIKRQVKDTGLESLFENYFSTIIYLDDTYLQDNVHWDKSFINEHRIEFLNEIKKRLN